MALSGTAGRSAASGRAAYLALLSLAVVDAAGYSVIAPVAPAIARASGAGPGVIGCLVASFPLGMIAGFALAAPAVKRGRTSALLLASLALVAVGTLGFISSHTLAIWFGSRVVMGLGSGGLWMGITFATLERWPGQEYLCMSRVFAAYSLGGLVGPALGALGGIRAPFGAYLCLTGAAAVGTVALRSGARTMTFRSDRAALRLPGFATASLAIAFVVLALGMAEGVLPLHFADRLDQRAIGILYAVIAVLATVSAALAARVRPRPLMLGACGVIVGGLALAGASSVVPLWIGALVLIAIGIGAGNTAAIGLLFEAVGAERAVTAMIVWSQLGIVGYLAGPLAGGVTAQVLGYQAIALVPLALALPLVRALVRGT